MTRRLALATQPGDKPGRSLWRDKKFLRGDWLPAGLPPALSGHQNYYYWRPRGLYRRMHAGCEFTFECGIVDLESGHVSAVARTWLHGSGAGYVPRVGPKIVENGRL